MFLPNSTRKRQTPTFPSRETKRVLTIRRRRRGRLRNRLVVHLPRLPQAAALLPDDVPERQIPVVGDAAAAVRQHVDVLRVVHRVQLDVDVGVVDLGPGAEYAPLDVVVQLGGGAPGYADAAAVVAVGPAVALFTRAQVVAVLGHVPALLLEELAGDAALVGIVEHLDGGRGRLGVVGRRDAVVGPVLLAMEDHEVGVGQVVAAGLVGRAGDGVGVVVVETGDPVVVGIAGGDRGELGGVAAALGLVGAPGRAEGVGVRGHLGRLGVRDRWRWKIDGELISVRFEFVSILTVLYHWTLLSSKICVILSTKSSQIFRIAAELCV